MCMCVCVYIYIYIYIVYLFFLICVREKLNVTCSATNLLDMIMLVSANLAAGVSTW